MAQKAPCFILRNHPIMGHFRFIFEFIRPEIRQYASSRAYTAGPTSFSRAQRLLEAHQRSKGQADNRPFPAHSWT